MATIQEELNYLEETKGLIKNAIINKGQDITDQDSFRSYVNKIENISTVNLQSKTIDPTTNQQIITPDQPNYNGLSSVTINAVTSNIDNNITVENIRSGVSILGVTGNYSGIDTSDATATADDIVTVQHSSHGEGYYIPKTAYVNGNKINGNIKETRSINGQIPESPTIARVENISNIGTWTNYIVFNTTIQSNYSYVVNNTSLLRISVLNTALTNVFNITSDKLLNGYKLFGVTGNYIGPTMKEYASEIAMNNDIANISEGEVVKVVENNITTFYVKETTMKKLVKEEDTISPEEYDEAIDTANDILGEEE